MMTVVPPTDRTCTRCGRTETWDEDAGTWTAAADGDDGTPHCLHEWDINGTYNPIREDA